MMHYRNYCLLLLLALWVLPLRAQSVLPDTNPKVRAVQAVLQRLLPAFGQPPNGNPPLLRIYQHHPDSKLILELHHQQGQAVIDMQESLYDLCAQQFGPQMQDALAILLGHELVHLYANHQWIAQFGLSRSPNKTAASNTAKALAEEQADYLGTFYAYLSGYQPYKIYEPLIQAIYARYKLPEQLEGYPVLKERVATSAESHQKAQELIAAFRAGLLLMATGHYPQAEQAFLYVIKENEATGLKGPKEAYNNAASALLWQVMEQTGKEAMPYLLPIESDVRLRKLKSRSNAGEALNPAALLARANQHLDKALAIDKHYTAAALNWMAARLLAQNPEAVIGKIKEAKAEPTNAAWLTMGAVAYTLADKNEAAAPLFEQADKMGAWYAKANLETFQQRSSLIDGSMQAVRGIWQKLVAGDFAATPKKCLPPTPPATALIAPQNVKARDLSEPPLYVRMEYADRTEAENSPMVLKTSEQAIYVWPVKTLTAPLGKQLIELYGEPRAIGHTCWYFAACGLLAELDEAGKVLRQWHVYAEE